ncbi:MAG: RnfH family protein [Pseudomonadota bacterium]
MVNITVVYATVEQQKIYTLAVPQGTNLLQAAQLSNIELECSIDLQGMSLGVFGQLKNNPLMYLVQEGDRVEIYRPLLLDPKEIRRQRAIKSKVLKGEKKL